ncbi:MAG: hypothetical protein ACOX3H_10585 [Saccharofermentanales bacterium]|jgi:hypothetical protein
MQDTLKGKKLLLLGGSRNMKEILDAAQAMGIQIGVTDWYNTDVSPVKLMADEYFDVSITDYPALQKLIRENNYDGVTTGYTDSYLEPYAKLCDLCDLPCYGTPEQFSILTNKEKYKKLFKEFGVPTLEPYSADQIDQDFNGYPLMLKPIEGSGGKGLEIVYDYAEYKKVINNENVRYLIEPYIAERNEMTAFFLFIDHEVYLSGTANRFLSKPQGEKIGLPVFYSFPSSYDAVFRKYTAQPMKEMFKSLGVKDGMLFAQCMIHEGVVKVYDLGYRLTGSLEYKLQEKMYGFNPLKMMIHHSLTGKMLPDDSKPDIERLMQNDIFGFNVTMLGKEGTIERIEGYEKIMQIPGVIDCAFKMIAGESIKEHMIGTLGQIVARIFFTADTLNTSMKTLEEIYRNIKIIDTQGNDMILDTFNINDIVKFYNMN